MQHSKPEKGILAPSGPNGTCQSVQGSAQEIENARVAFMLALAGTMIFWRLLLRIVLATVVVVVGVGAFVLLQDMHH
jgi:hypothetical protein